MGLDNYAVVLNYHTFWLLLRNSVFYWIAHSIPMMLIAFLLAILVHSKLAPWLKLFKAVIFLPQMLATVAAALLFQNFFGTRYGVLNSLLGIEIPWLTSQSLAPWTVVAMLIWRDTGYWFIIFLAGLTTINPDIDDAARIDGASELQRLVRITLPAHAADLRLCLPRGRHRHPPAVRRAERARRRVGRARPRLRRPGAQSDRAEHPRRPVRPGVPPSAGCCSS